MNTVRRFTVNSERNSECSVPLESLDWKNWFTDGGASMYLHVYQLGDDGAICRVRCRRSDSPRLASLHGVLYWLVD